MGRTIYEIVDEYVRELSEPIDQFLLAFRQWKEETDGYWKGQKHPDVFGRDNLGKGMTEKQFSTQFADLFPKQQKRNFSGVQLPKVGHIPSPARWPSNVVLGTPPVTRTVSYPSPVHEIVFTDEEFAAVSITMDEITFNDRPISDVISYDETTGEIHYYERHWSSGDLVADGTDPTGYRTQREKGNIKVVNKYVPPKKETPPADATEGFGNPWYPHGIPGFTESANNVSFEWQGWDDTVYLAPDGSSTKSLGALLNKLCIDGVELGDLWTITGAEERGNDLVLCFVKTVPFLGVVALARNVDLGTLGLMGKAREVVGMPHIYKTVRIQGANFSIYTPRNWTGSSCDPDQWLDGSVVTVKGHPAPVNQTTAKVMNQLCS
jgi:hypothetical protein